MDNKHSGSLGEQVIKAVDDILASGNFDKLNSVVSDTVSKALDEVRKQLAQVASEQGTQKGQKDTEKTISRKAQYGAGQFTQAAYKPAEVHKTVHTPRVKIKKVGRFSGLLLRFFGGMGTGLFGFIFLVLLLDFDSGMLHAGVLFAISFLVLYLGMSKRSRLKRAERYIQLMAGGSYINLSDLASLTNKTEAFVLSDVRKIIRLGIFPEGHLDTREKCLIIGDVTYREYLRLEQSRRAFEQTVEKRDAEQAENPELNAMIQEGNECIRKLRELNDAIEGEVISEKLFKLENLLKEIFEQVKEHPEQMPEMRKFMNYYLPTTLKLVMAYEEFDQVSVQGEDIRAAKTEIEKTLDTINMAFAELLNKLFRDRAFDATTDAQVLKTMLAQEGLTRESVFTDKTGENKPVEL